MALPKLMRDIFENNGAGPKFLENRVPKGFSEAISAPGASFTGNVSAAMVNAISLVATAGSELGYTRIRDAGCLFIEANGSKGLGMSADLPDGTYGGIVSVRNANDPQNPGGIYFYTRSPESGINITHGLQFRNDGSLLLDSKKMVYVTDTVVSSDHNWWYRKYSDGWIEQGGNITPNTSTEYTITLTLPTPFSDNNWTCVMVPNGNSSASIQLATTGYVKTSSAIKAWRHNNVSGYSWFACGY